MRWAWEARNIEEQRGLDTENIQLLRDVRICSSNADQNCQSLYERFYPALTGCWLNIEAQRFTMVAGFRRRAELLQALYKVEDLVTDNAGSLAESLHMMEVSDFVYGFLMRHLPCARADTFTKWAIGDLPTEHNFVETFERIETCKPTSPASRIFLYASNNSGSHPSNFAWLRR